MNTKHTPIDSNPSSDWENPSYRKGVGMILVNKDNKVFVAQRVDTRENAWQMPQGGIGRNEETDQAMLRELQEEIGTRNVEIIVKSKKWYRYDFPEDLAKKLWSGKYKGQEQLWYILRFRGEDKEININTHHPEFRDWKWVDISEVSSLIISFKRDLYEEVIADLWPFIARENPS